mmetsp:Transcript_80036/g.242971  ORF Transcript_80036/g.242971 Transcript_80036/m.242971 type:complete len:218 (-) Transcript_80036:1-654(-)
MGTAGAADGVRAARAAATGGTAVARPSACSGASRKRGWRHAGTATAAAAAPAAAASNGTGACSGRVGQCPPGCSRSPRGEAQGSGTFVCRRPSARRCAESRRVCARGRHGRRRGRRGALEAAAAAAETAATHRRGWREGRRHGGRGTGRPRFGRLPRRAARSLTLYLAEASAVTAARSGDAQACSAGHPRPGSAGPTRRHWCIQMLVAEMWCSRSGV